MPLVIRIGGGLILIKSSPAAALHTIDNLLDDLSDVSVEWMDGRPITMPDLKLLAGYVSSTPEARC